MAGPSATGLHSSKETLQQWRAVGDAVSDLTGPEIEPKDSAPITLSLAATSTGQPALGVSVESVHLVVGRLGFSSQSGHTKDLKNSIRSFRARRSAQAEVRRVLCMCCSSCYVPSQRSIIRD